MTNPTDELVIRETFDHPSTVIQHVYDDADDSTYLVHLMLVERDRAYRTATVDTYRVVLNHTEKAVYVTRLLSIPHTHL